MIKSTIRKTRRHNLPSPPAKMPARDDHGKSQAKAQLESIKGMVSRLDIAIEQDNNGGADETEAARNTILEDALSVEVRGGWHSVGAQDAAAPFEFKILLCTGGPAVQIIGELDNFNQPETVRLQYQD